MHDVRCWYECAIPPPQKHTNTHTARHNDMPLHRHYATRSLSICLFFLSFSIPFALLPFVRCGSLVRSFNRMIVYTVRVRFVSFERVRARLCAWKFIQCITHNSSFYCSLLVITVLTYRAVHAQEWERAAAAASACAFRFESGHR